MSRASFSLSAVLCAFLSLSGWACSSDDSDGPAPECEEIIEACHDVDPGEGPINECHESAEEEWSQSECQANLDMCVELCTAASSDAGVGQP